MRNPDIRTEVVMSNPRDENDINLRLSSMHLVIELAKSTGEGYSLDLIASAEAIYQYLIKGKINE